MVTYIEIFEDHNDYHLTVGKRGDLIMYFSDYGKLIFPKRFLLDNDMTQFGNNLNNIKNDWLNKTKENNTEEQLNTNFII